MSQSIDVLSIQNPLIWQHQIVFFCKSYQKKFSKKMSHSIDMLSIQTDIKNLFDVQHQIVLLYKPYEIGVFHFLLTKVL